MAGPTSGRRRTSCQVSSSDRRRTRVRETEVARAISTIPISDRPILAYAEDDYTWGQLGPYLNAVMDEHGLPVVYVTSDTEDPTLHRSSPADVGILISESLSTFLPAVDSPVFVTTMPDLDSFHIKRPQASTCVYVFPFPEQHPHGISATGIRRIRRVLLHGTAPHGRTHTRYFSQIGKTDYDLREVGYPKLDRIAANYRSYHKVHPDETTILIRAILGPGQRSGCRRRLTCRHPVAGRLSGCGSTAPCLL